MSFLTMNHMIVNYYNNTHDSDELIKRSFTSYLDCEANKNSKDCAMYGYEPPTGNVAYYHIDFHPINFSPEGKLGLYVYLTFFSYLRKGSETFSCDIPKWYIENYLHLTDEEFKLGLAALGICFWIKESE